MAAKGREEWDIGSNFHPIVSGQRRLPEGVGLGSSQVLSDCVKGKGTPPGRG